MSNKDLNIIFFGNTDFSNPTLLACIPKLAKPTAPLPVSPTATRIPHTALSKAKMNALQNVN